MWSYSINGKVHIFKRIGSTHLSDALYLELIYDIDIGAFFQYPAHRIRYS